MQYKDPFLKMSINLFIKHKAYSALEEYIRENEPIKYEDISPYNDKKLISYITRIRSDDPLNMSHITKYRNLTDIYYTDVYLSNITDKDRRTFYQEARVLAKCTRGHFHVSHDRIMHWYLYFIFYVIGTTKYKYDWVLCSPNNIIHIREQFFWVKNCSSISYKIMRSLLRNYQQVYTVIPRLLVKLDDYAMEFIKNTTNDDMTCLKYGVMDKSLFETIISEHIRSNTSHSSYVLRWMSNYNVGNIPSPNVVLKYISTSNPSNIYQSPIYQTDLNNERNMILSTSSK